MPFGSNLGKDECPWPSGSVPWPSRRPHPRLCPPETLAFTWQTLTAKFRSHTPPPGLVYSSFLKGQREATSRNVLLGPGASAPTWAGSGSYLTCFKKAALSYLDMVFKSL